MMRQQADVMVWVSLIILQLRVFNSVVTADMHSLQMSIVTVIIVIF